MFTIRQQLIRFFVIFFSFSLLPSVRVFAAPPSVTGVSGPFTESSTITITGSDFGDGGPNVVIFDNFEGGTHGDLIKTGSGSATVGKWDQLLANNPPKYDNQYSVSGNLAFKTDFTKQTAGGSDAATWARVMNINTRDVFLSYWVMMPTTSTFPCYQGHNANWKLTWLWGGGSIPSNDDDQIIPVILGGSNCQTGLNGENTISCNDCGSTPPAWRLYMVKGKWYRIWAWIHGTEDNTSRRSFWALSTDDSRPVTTYLNNYTGRVFGADNGSDPPKYFESFVIAPWARLCQPCTESAPRYDDVYLATGANARARVVIGNAPVYTDCTNLALLTPTSWSNIRIEATVRQGSFKDGDTAYLFVVDANGNISAGYGPVNVGSGTGSVECLFIGSRVTADPADVSLRWAPYPAATSYRIERLISGEGSPTVIVANTDKLTYKDNNPTSLDSTYTLYPLNSSGQTLTSCVPLVISGM